MNTWMNVSIQGSTSLQINIYKQKQGTYKLTQICPATTQTNLLYIVNLLYINPVDS